jgi:hypothetical protein
MLGDVILQNISSYKSHKVSSQKMAFFIVTTMKT